MTYGCSTRSRFVWLVLAAAALAGCAEMEGLGDKMKDAMKRAAAQQSAASQPGGTATAAAANPFKGTELDGIFKKNPISNSNRPETWPRVAVTIKSATAGVHAMSGAGTLRDNDCIVFDVRLWKSAGADRRFDNLKLCTDHVAALAKGVAFRTLDLFPRYTFHAGQNTTAARRTDGPTPPFYMFPQDIRSQQEWILMKRNTTFFLGAVMLALGYDWDDDFDRRLWVVSVPLTAAPY